MRTPPPFKLPENYWLGVDAAVDKGHDRIYFSKYRPKVRYWHPPFDFVNISGFTPEWMKKACWDQMDQSYKIRKHLHNDFPGIDWLDLISKDCAIYCNSVLEMEKYAVANDYNYKWGGTANIVRRWEELGLCRQYKFLLYVVTEDVSVTSSLESSLIEFYTNHTQPSRGKCVNRSKGGGGLGAGIPGKPSPVYLAMR